MPKSSRLSGAALTRIENAEQKAAELLADQIRPYTLPDKKLILLNGKRVCNRICEYAEKLLDAHAAEHRALSAPDFERILKEEIVPDICDLAEFQWDLWLGAVRVAYLEPTSLETPRGSTRGIREIRSGTDDRDFSEQLEGLISGFNTRLDSTLADGVRRLTEAAMAQPAPTQEASSSVPETANTEHVSKATKVPTPKPTSSQQGPRAAARRRAVDAYIEEGWAEGRKIKRMDIWKQLGHDDPTEFQRWQRDDPRTTLGAAKKIERLLEKKPHLKSAKTP